MSISRPCDHWEPNPQEAMGLDPFTIQMQTNQVVDPRLNNGTPFTETLTHPLQVLDPMMGLSGNNDRAMILQAAAQRDPRMSRPR